MPRIYCSTRLGQHTALDLPSDAAKHCQVLRLQPLDALTLFDGFGGEYQAHIVEMGRQTVHVRVQDFDPIERDNKHQVHLIIGMPANDRMDWLVEKATELGVHRITPVMTSRSVVLERGPGGGPHSTDSRRQRVACGQKDALHAFTARRHGA